MTTQQGLWRGLKEKLPAVAPSMLSADFGRFREEVQAVEALGVEVFHLDVMDGHFVPNITFGPKVVKAVSAATCKPLDVHLMIEKPENYVEAFAEAGATVLTVHAEACVHLHRVLQQIHDLGLAAGVSLNPATPIAILEEVAREVDLVLVMTVNPGFGGQKFVEGGLSKLRRTRQLLDEAGSHAVLEADGGIGVHNAEAVAEAGVELLVAGSALLGASQRRQAFQQLNEAARRGSAARKDQ